MITAGLDLAADPSRTALAVIEWSDTGALVRSLRLGVDDEEVRHLAPTVAMLGIDCPLGWPRAFTEFIVEHQQGTFIPPAEHGSAWRDSLSYRVTDLQLRAASGPNPLSVSADKIGRVAMRCAALLAQLGSAGVDCHRDGSGTIAEVYPAAALHRWGLPHRAYKTKTNQAGRAVLVDALERESWLDLGGYAASCRHSDDLLDAVLCALVARAVTKGLTVAPSPLEREAALVEGWIHVPRIGGQLRDLAPDQPG
ncbi:DUF429 domain-containing protein [Ammonicoccus fulvus]|uniref:DUF429 domain-containing protein n=1 Tax=Ammonicoccus fulvus TaxID=3138240 RepID=A0ABZ3FPE5_9ACTN